jgi:4-hydroxy-3-polyprenylbenzoate decarboxylase
MQEHGPSPRRLIIGITGASGSIYGIRMLEKLRPLEIETHLVMTKAAEVTLAYETDMKVAEVHALADKVYPYVDIGAAISSGSFKTMGMVIAPCSIKSMGEIATGVTGNLLSRAADVVLKERRRLVLMLRETPFHAGHIRAMAQVTEMGGIIAPPVPAFYARPKSVDDIVNQSVARVLDLFDIEAGAKRWTEDVQRTRGK